MTTSSAVRVLLLWPGTEGAAAGNFGVPQLVPLATYLREHTGADVHIVDLGAERAFGPVALDKLLGGPDGDGYDIVAVSAYSSFDHLKCEALAGIVRELHPECLIVAGGYHASARPNDYIYDGSPFDVCVVGEGERPLVRITESVQGGAPMRQEILGPEPLTDLSVLPPTDWSFLDRYRPVARRIASQAQVYLSRGCPFDCAFCMERAKRETAWRPLPVERAIEELHLLDRWLGLEGWTLFVADALFGMKPSWRRAFLERLARDPIPVDKLWLLIRVDLIEDEDLALFAETNCAMGFGLESGDPAQLARIRKAGRLDEYLDRTRHVARRARQLDLPWGANIICGHPGETPESMATSAAFMRELFLGPEGTTGFLSVDPFRIYPGSPIDAERDHYERTYGTRFHRTEWWQDGDQAFLSEWVDPSAELDWRTREALQHEHFAPVLAEMEAKFVYGGKARDYFLRAIREQRELTQSSSRLHAMDRFYAWQRYLGFGSRADQTRRAHRALADVAGDCRRAARKQVAKTAQVAEDHPVMEAIAIVPRERFVPVDQIRDSTRDVAVPLDGSGQATVSAMHAYARAFSLLDVRPGDRVLDLGAGTGYGAAILQRLVGEAGTVWAVELDPTLAATARRNLGDGIEVAEGDALDPSSWPTDAHTADKVYVGFAVPELPAPCLDALSPGTIIVAPVESNGTQRLARLRAGAPEVELLDEVAYVRARPPPHR